MFDSIKSALVSWNNTKDHRQKLQHTYLVIAAVVVFGSGIISLLDADAGNKTVKVALFAVAVFFANAVVWNLLDSSLLSKLPKKPRRK